VKCGETATAGVRRVEGLQHLDVVEGFPQGVCARVFPKIQSWESSGRINPSNLLRDSSVKLFLEELSKRRKFTLWVDEFREGTLGYLQESPSKDRRSIFSEEDSRHPVSC
jgi:hypothetical protein